MGIRLREHLATACLFGTCAFAPVAWAQSLHPLQPAMPSARTEGAPDTPPTSLPILIEITEQLDSARQRRGDTFGLRLAQEVTLPDGSTLAAGTPGRGEVVHADRARSGGKPGELILAARNLDGPQGSLRLRALRLTGTGTDRSSAAIGASIAAASAGPAGALLGIFIQGGQVVVPAGTRGVAKLELVPQTRMHESAPSDTQPNQETPL